MVKIFTKLFLNRRIKRKIIKIHGSYDYREYPILQNDFFLHSMSNFYPIVEWFIDKILRTPRALLEIGIEKGIATQSLIKFCRRKGIHYIGIDPLIPEEVKQQTLGRGDVHFLEGKSLEVIPRLYSSLESRGVPRPNVIIIDGDHNYYTLFNELKYVITFLKREGGPYLIFMHDLSWPNAFRDSYYNPQDIPGAYLHPHSFEQWVKFGVKRLQETGSITPRGRFAYALEEGTPQNGLIPAVRDIISMFSSEGLVLIVVPVVWGMGILIPLNKFSLIQRIKLLFFLDIYERFFPLLWTLERNRLELLESFFTVEKELKRANKDRKK